MCGRKAIDGIVEGYNWFTTFVDKKDIGHNPASLFFLDDHSISMTVRNDRWKELRKNKKETKGISTAHVVVLDSEYVEIPELNQPEKFDWVLDCFC